MTKPKLAEGSRCSESGVITDRRNVDIFTDNDGDLWSESDSDGEYINPNDAIRALVEGGQLPLWDAAVRLKDAHAKNCACDDSDLDVQDIREALLDLIVVIDQMKETM